ncbi:tetrahydrofolate dehydrogenase/cyclohydrolase catalytic domain-containing protein [uncultured Clostridium sp.]|jgi:methylenetetrahydrofolate dehydrogenase (NADP+)/methenyltetrahydrofolate cyclohydrolase|uniref:tetrahydrofolate dehydrogenase/cyclohydrolase catalytic domain-containing protein n=1 Tax=uncultured Clostridium sp. TaxID=59620 RepID=UPI00260253A1|nr:tetrahydrofolate dehydrogenase/cyclohydrolase catalytic domain-containing protein [uncultured Clostridium sp.]
MGAIINGKKISEDIKSDIRVFINGLKEEKKSLPKIASILVGEDGGSIYYQNFQEKMANDLGVKFEKIRLSNDIDKRELKILIEELNVNEEVNGIILLLPLPKHINESEITNLINPSKDIDCLSERTVGRFYKGEKSYKPCTPYSVITLLKSYNIDLEGANVAIIGRSNIVGKPLVQMFLNENATVTICHSRTKNLKTVTKGADIVIAAIGKPNFVDSSFISENAIVIDVGTTKFEGKITGDVNFDEVKDKASLITPVPGGVGALTTTLLFKNLCEGMK